MEARAEARYVRTSPQKVRLVVDLIRGQKAGTAINILRSANAENRHNDIDVDQLVVTEAYVNEGPRMKRIRPAPMGRAYRYQRRMAHIIVMVGDKQTEEKA
jgi:large subunit ribosomal protein L22